MKTIICRKNEEQDILDIDMTLNNVLNSVIKESERIKGDGRYTPDRIKTDADIEIIIRRKKQKE